MSVAGIYGRLFSPLRLPSPPSLISPSLNLLSSSPPPRSLQICHLMLDELPWPSLEAKLDGLCRAWQGVSHALQLGEVQLGPLMLMLTAKQAECAEQRFKQQRQRRRFGGLWWSPAV
jgi:hypothetical protein